MLIISRKIGETVQIGPDVFVQVCEVGVGRVRLMIQAPKDARILRHDMQIKDADPTVQIKKGLQL